MTKAPTPVPLARDTRGRTLCRAKDTWAQEADYRLFLEDGSYCGVEIWEFAPGQVTGIAFTGVTPFPLSWLLWILVEFYGGIDHDFLLESLHLGVPLELPFSDWEELEQIIEQQEMELLIERLERRSSSVVDTRRTRMTASRELAEKIDVVLTWVNLFGLRKIPPEAFAIVGSWTASLPGEVHLELETYRQAQEDGSTRIAHVLSWGPHPQRKGGSNRQNLTRFSLVDLFRDSGLWVLRGQKEAWVAKHMERPRWLIDQALLEPYRLLGLKNPLGAPWDEFLVWAKASGLID